MAESADMAEALRSWRGTREGAKWQQDRARLPVLSIKQDLLSQLQQHDVVVVSGDTGCGKTTQVGFRIQCSGLGARHRLCYDCIGRACHVMGVCSGVSKRRK